MVKRIVFYFTHFTCLGHTSRIFSIMQALKKTGKDRIQVHVFHGSRPQVFLKFDNCAAHVVLPHPLYNRSNFASPPKNNFLKLKERADFLLKKVARIEPDIFITEFFPFGRFETRYELAPALNFLKRKGCAIYCSLGYPFFNMKKAGTIGSYLGFYDRIFIHTPPKTETSAAVDYLSQAHSKKVYKHFFGRIHDKISFTGYVLPFNIDRDQTADPGGKTILITRGAGAYYPKIITNAIRASRYFPDRRFLVVAGPATSSSEWRTFFKLSRTCGSKKLFLKKYLPDLPYHVKRAEVVVSCASYNTSVLVMYFKKRAVLIPFKGYGKYEDFWEQPARASMLKRREGADILEYQRLDPESLRDAIARQLNRVSADGPTKKTDFRGAEKTAGEILSTL